MARPISRLTKVILGLPRALTAQQVLAELKAKGLKTSESNVHRVRRLYKADRPVAAKAGSRSVNKSDFVRTFPATVAAKEVVAKGKAQGVLLDLQYVYKIRSRSKPSLPKAVPTSSSTTPASANDRASGSTVEGLLRTLAAEIGLARALEILEGERARVRAFIGT